MEHIGTDMLHFLLLPSSYRSSASCTGFSSGCQMCIRDSHPSADAVEHLKQIDGVLKVRVIK